jgi:Na+/melibiose symporter-like transporter
MRIFYAGIPVVCLAISLVLTSMLPISEKDAHEVRRLLDERKKPLP